MEGGGVAVSQVAQEVGLDMSLHEELLVATLAGLAGGEELLVDAGVAKAGEGTAIQSESARGHDEVSALQAGVAAGRNLDELGIGGKEAAHARVAREELGELLMEPEVIGDDGRD